MLRRLGEVSTLLECSNQTVKNWVDYFGEQHFSEGARRTFGKRYDQGDFNTLKRIKEYRDQGVTLEEIATLLPLRATESEPDFSEDFSQDYSQPTNALQSSETTQFIKDLLEASHRQHQNEIAAKDETIEQLKERLKEKDDHIEDLKRRLPWWKR